MCKLFLTLLALFTALPSQAAVTFQVRGTQLNAYYSTAGAWHRTTRDSGSAIPALTSSGDPSVFGGSSIDLNSASGTRAIIWPGFSNWTQAVPVAVMVRIVPTFAGCPPSNQNIFFAGNPSSGTQGGLYINWNSDCTLSFVGLGEYGNTLIHGTTVASSNGAVGIGKDFMLSWDGVTITNGVSISVDGALLQQFDAVAAVSDYAPNRANSPVIQISVGSGPGSSGVSNFALNELVVFDNAQSAVYAARTTFFTASALDATSSQDPGVPSVNLGTGYVIAGVALTGTKTTPTAGQVKIGVTFGASLALTGTYTGSDRWTCPSASDLRSGASALKCDSTSTNLSGSLVVPSLANTKTGVAGDGGNGLYDGSDRWTCPSAAGRLFLGDTLKCNSLTVNLTGTLSPVTNSFCSANLATSATGTITRLTATRGDAANLVLYATDGAAALDLTGAVFTSYITGPGGTVVTLANAKHTADADQVTNKGKFILALSSADTLLMKPGSEKEILTKVVQGSSTIYFHGRKMLTVLPNGPVQ